MSSRTIWEQSFFPNHALKFKGHFGIDNINYSVSLVVVCYVTLCGWPAKQTIPLSVLARNQTKGFWTWNLAVSRSVNGTRKESWLGKGAHSSWRRDTDRGGRQWTSEQRGEAAWHEGPAIVKKIESRCRYSSCFVEFSLVIHASVSPYMLSEM